MGYLMSVQAKSFDKLLQRVCRTDRGLVPSPRDSALKYAWLNFTNSSWIANICISMYRQIVISSAKWPVRIGGRTSRTFEGSKFDTALDDARIFRSSKCTPFPRKNIDRRVSISILAVALVVYCNGRANVSFFSSRAFLRLGRSSNFDSNKSHSQS